MRRRSELADERRSRSSKGRHGGYGAAWQRKSAGPCALSTVGRARICLTERSPPRSAFVLVGWSMSMQAPGWEADAGMLQYTSELSAHQVRQHPRCRHWQVPEAKTENCNYRKDVYQSGVW
ncbi:unnamed protein product [Urochloa humidicola]